MPTLPSGADFDDHEWVGTYDPRDVAVPTPNATVTANEYVVDAFYAGANPPTDADEGDNAITGTVYGIPSRPRLTPPAINGAAQPAGTKIFIYGENTPLPTSVSTNRKVDYSTWGAKNYALEFNGTSANPCWIIGIDKPRILTDRAEINDSTHFIIDGIYFEGFTDGEGGGLELSRNNYMTIRNGGQYGSSTGSGGGNGLTITGQVGSEHKFFLYHNNEMAYFGNHGNLPVSLIGPKPDDFHGFRPLTYCYWTWCTSNHIHHIGADACQVQNSANVDPSEAQRPHYVYFAGNECHFLGENMFDAKNSYHCIVSENLGYDTDEAIILLPNDGEGNLCSHHFAIANNLHKLDADWGNQNNFLIGMQGDHNGAFAAAIGNFLHDQAGPGINISFGDPTTPNRQNVVNNTFSRITTAVNVNQFQADPIVDHVTELQANLVLDCTTGFNIQAANSGDLTLNVIDNQFFGNTTNIDDTDVSGPYIDSETGTLTTDPNVVNSAGTVPANFAPVPASDAIDGTTEHSIYQAFEDLYGLDIRKDILGTTWLSTDTNINIGAVQ